ncbi:MAG: Hpt domain-containing protein, partial [Gemmatimonadaceae bacterium]|nr:Hpt domain-containing protein [Gemmatimonadaceae bacterium]
MNTKRYAELFRAEARERLVEMNTSLLAIERGAGADRIAELFRAVHTMKGMSAAMGYEPVRDLSHSLETLLDKLRREPASVTPAVIDALFDAVDALESATVAVCRNADAKPDVSGIIGMLDSISATDEAAEFDAAAL